MIQTLGQSKLHEAEMKRKKELAAKAKRVPDAFKKKPGPKKK